MYVSAEDVLSEVTTTFFWHSLKPGQGVGKVVCRSISKVEMISSKMITSVMLEQSTSDIGVNPVRSKPGASSEQIIVVD